MPFDRLSRRDALFMLGAGVLAPARAQGGLLRATRVDHVALAVGDIGKAVGFYRRLFGNEVLKNKTTPRRYLRLGPCYMAIAPAEAGESKRIDHFSIGIENFNAQNMKATLEKAGLKVVRESNVGLFIADPDGTSIQIYADQSWKQLTDAVPEDGPKQEALFHSLGMHHVAIQTGDITKATEFYGKLFGASTPSESNPRQPTFMAGETRIVLYNPVAGKPPKIDHFSVLVQNFDAPSVVKVVQSLGATGAQLSRQGTFNEFFDPEGIRLQVTFPGQSYAPPPAKK